MAVQRHDMVARTRESVSDKLPRKVSDKVLGTATECEMLRATQGRTAWHLEIVQAEPQPDKPFDFEDWLATVLVDYWCSIHGGTRGK